MSGAIFYRGQSQIDGGPIVAIATNLTRKSKNEKTGDMIQTFFLRGDVNPFDAVMSGTDRSVCGNCPMRWKHGSIGACYVNVAKALCNVWQAYKRGTYPWLEGKFVKKLKAKPLRLGTYGNPSSVPLALLKWITGESTGWTGYEHNWRTCDQRLKQLCMASVESEEGMQEAIKKGWRTFRVKTETGVLLPK